VPDAVRLMTAHAAKGLEFTEVFVLRVTSNSFPKHYKPPLFDLPAELRSRMSQAEDSKELHHEEERRLLYVAMTRARDTLMLCAPPGRGQKETRPAGMLRAIIGKPALDRFLRMTTIASAG